MKWHSHSGHRDRRAMLVAGVSTALLAVYSFAPAAGAESTARPWTVEPSPNPTGVLASGLAAVSCPAAGSCVAVGGSAIASGGQIPNTALLVEQLSDGTWTIASTPAIPHAKSTDLSDVSCATTGFCVAVGSVQYGRRPPDLLAETWNGTSWRARVLPNPPGGNTPALAAVSCAAQGSCVAAGGYVGDKSGDFRPLAMRLDGSTWSVLPAPIPPHGNGTGNSEYTDVDCTTATLCETVGIVGYNDTLQNVFAYALNGSTFTFQRQVNPGPDPGNTDAAVSCSATGACTSVGFMQVIGEEALAEHWDGSTWARQATPFPAKRAADALYDTSCDGGSSCVAVGESWIVDPHNGHLIDPRVMGEVWNGTAWSQSQPVVPSGVSAALSGISCTSPTACIAVGGASTSTSESTLVEAYTG